MLRQQDLGNACGIDCTWRETEEKISSSLHRRKEDEEGKINKSLMAYVRPVAAALKAQQELGAEIACQATAKATERVIACVGRSEVDENKGFQNCGKTHFSKNTR